SLMAVASSASSSSAGTQLFNAAITSIPLTSVGSVLANSTPQSVTIGQQTFNIGDFTDIANPSANQLLGRTAPNTVTFNAGNTFTAVYQFGHPNIDQALNQCAPAAVANSLDWLRTTQGLAVPAANPNTPGLRVADGPPAANTNALVGVLESGAFM